MIFVPPFVCYLKIARQTHPDADISMGYFGQATPENISSEAVSHLATVIIPNEDDEKRSDLLEAGSHVAPCCLLL
jgi:hypothetical protein